MNFLNYLSKIATGFCLIISIVWIEITILSPAYKFIGDDGVGFSILLLLLYPFFRILIVFLNKIMRKDNRKKTNTILVILHFIGLFVFFVAIIEILSIAFKS